MDVPGLLENSFRGILVSAGASPGDATRAARLCAAVVISAYAGGVSGAAGQYKLPDCIAPGWIRALVPQMPGDPATFVANRLVASGLIIQIACGLLSAFHAVAASPECEDLREAAARLARLDTSAL